MRTALQQQLRSCKIKMSRRDIHFSQIVLDSTVNPDHINPRPVGLPEAPEDAVTRVLNKAVPLSVQYHIRDSGALRNLMDNGAYLAAGSLVIANPFAVGKFLDLGRCLEEFSYGRLDTNRLHVYRYNRLNRFTAQSSSSSAAASSSSSASSPSSTVMIFVHGGAWGSGKPWHYRLMVEKLAKCVNASVGIVVQYPVYPNAKIAEQADCIYDALRYIRSNSELLKLPPNAKIIMGGHSSGANISALAIMKSVEECLQPPLVDCFVGFSGVYDIDRHYLFEATRGVHDISPMAAAAISRDRFWVSSPTRLVAKADPDKIKRHWPPTLLLHGQLDTTVPFTSSKELADQLLVQGGRCVETNFPYEVTRGTHRISSRDAHFSTFSRLPSLPFSRSLISFPSVSFLPLLELHSNATPFSFAMFPFMAILLFYSINISMATWTPSCT